VSLSANSAAPNVFVSALLSLQRQLSTIFRFVEKTFPNRLKVPGKGYLMFLTRETQLIGN